MIKVPLSWLKDYVDITMSPEELAAGLTLRGLEVGGIIRTGADWDKVLVGEVLSIEKHPNADRLVVVQATDGTQNYQVVTGAMNLQVGDKFPLALAGARLIDGHKLVDEQAEGKRTPPLLSGELPYFTIKPGKMRGVESQAVAVAALELGVSEDFEGILVLDRDAPVGAPLADVLGEVILDIELSPNLGRALSMVGVAREVAAMTGQKARWPQIEVHESGPAVAEKLSVKVEAPDLCPRFSAMVIEGVKIGPSPEWMQRRLTAAGIRPISNIVDVTNYVMLEIGQPLHSYDYDHIHGHQLIVRRAAVGEKLETIDHKVHELTPEVLLVADADRSLGMAGVMGGADSEISDTTTNVALEGANWDSANIRQTARGLFNTVSEAGKRFERSVDIELTVLGVRRGIQLMQQLAGGRVAQGIIDVYPEPRSPHVIKLPMSEITRLLGVTIPRQEVIKMLEALEFEVAELRPDGSYQFRHSDSQFTIMVSEAESTNDVLMVRVPTYRNDVTIKADLVEEVARQYGYDKIPESRLEGELPHQFTNYNYQFDDRLRDILTACGLYEVITYPPVSTAGLEILDRAAGQEANRWNDPARLWKLANPLSAEHEVMRPTLLSSVLEVVAENRRFMERVAIFEVGRIYLPTLPGGDTRLPYERRTVALALSGSRDLLSRYHPKVNGPTDLFDFFDLKGMVEALLNRLNIPLAAIQLEVSQENGAHALHPGRSAQIYYQLGKEPRIHLGILGEVHPSVVEGFGLDPLERITVAEINVEALQELALQREQYQVVTRMPVVTQDLAIVVPEEVPAGRVQTLIKETGGKLLTEVTLFDLYRGKPIPEGKKSLAFRLFFYPQDKTLTEDEVTAIRQRIEKRLVRELGAETRG